MLMMNARKLNVPSVLLLLLLQIYGVFKPTLSAEDVISIDQKRSRATMTSDGGGGEHIVGTKGSKTFKTHAQKLYDDLFTEYNADLRPTRNESRPINVSMHLWFKQVLKVYWVDELLQWDPDDYDGIRTLRVPSQRIWRPDILVYNNADMNINENEISTNAVLNYTGHITNFRAIITKVTCNLEMTYFPFDQQTCNMMFASWSYDGSKVWIEPAKNKQSNLEYYIENTEWKLLNFSWKPNVNYYDCCPEPYPDITYYFVLERNPSYYILNLIIPSVFITVVTMVGFFTPYSSTGENTEKVSLGVTALLSLAIILLMVADKMPATSKVIPLIGKYYIGLIWLIFAATIITTVTLRLQSKGNAGKPLSPETKRLFFHYIARMLFMKVDLPPPKSSAYARRQQQQQHRKGDYSKRSKQSSKRHQHPQNNRHHQYQFANGYHHKNHHFMSNGGLMTETTFLLSTETSRSAIRRASSQSSIGTAVAAAAAAAAECSGSVGQQHQQQRLSSSDNEQHHGGGSTGRQQQHHHHQSSCPLHTNNPNPSSSPVNLSTPSHHHYCHHRSSTPQRLNSRTPLQHGSPGRGGTGGVSPERVRLISTSAAGSPRSLATIDNLYGGPGNGHAAVPGSPRTVFTAGAAALNPPPLSAASGGHFGGFMDTNQPTNIIDTDELDHGLLGGSNTHQTQQYSELVRQLEQLRHVVRAIDGRLEQEQDLTAIRKEWEQLSRVCERMLMIIFVFITVLFAVLMLHSHGQGTLGYQQSTVPPSSLS